MNIPIKESSWWYDDAAFHADSSILVCACLYVLVDGTAEIMGEDWREQFDSEAGAKSWLNCEEYSPIIELREEYGLTVKLPMIRT